MALSFIYFGFWWGYRLDELPGLHADEAWAGLMAYAYKDKLDSLTGMNNYTGILQPYLVSLIFHHIDAGVFELRISTVFFNFCGVAIISRVLYHFSRWHVIVFLLIFSQSALLMVTTRIAWEVNTFTLFLMSIILLSIHRLIKTESNSPAYCFLFLVVNLAGTYNHILFSSLSVSLLIGSLICIAGTKRPVPVYLLYILFANIFNLILLFFTMRYLLGLLSLKSGLAVSVIFLFTAMIESFMLSKIRTQGPAGGIKVRPEVITIAILLATCTFLVFHSSALLDVLTNYKILTNIYSYTPSILEKVLLFALGSLFLVCIFYSLFADFFRKTAFVWPAVVILSYMGILSIYTTNNSFRYYLIIYVMLSVYITHKIVLSPHRKKIMVALTVSFFLMNFSLIEIYLVPHRKLKAVELVVGNGQDENSGHFLPKKPLIDFLKSKKAGQIIYGSDRYFIEQPVLFYRKLNPWPEDINNSVIVDFNPFTVGNGFILMEKTKPLP
ncbi:hypothetical protein ACFOG5_06010 [Pedobacter fastidiosus]|uniref:Dolichyl-phosphate-mannose-protein mannosyltransferase n=1 Tax=Pedobacter fastidiosus TaxID=2765361 RepID=A0ABR7KQC9_9SPHI|nr:hypothetical protein [Pedobacter fastidiosus]MBC6110306.1 hypothetical protein [Pedobacter fastidiosus]